MISDTLVHAPPESGPFGYNAYRGPAKGQSFTDPVFGSVITRLTDETGKESSSDLYGKCGFWNADGTRMWHHAPDGPVILDTTSGGVVRANAPGNFDGSFSPVTPDVWFFFDGRKLCAYSIASGTVTIVKQFPATLGRLGGSVDWISSNGRYMVIVQNRRARVWDKQTDALYAGEPPGDAGDGWVGITPDGAYIVTALGQWKRSHRIDHDAKTVDPVGVTFWNLCGGHGSFVSASNGRTYFVTFECHSEAAIYAVDVSLPQTDDTAGIAAQRSSNRKLIDTAWADDGHFAGVARGPMQDWCFVSLEARDDLFDGPLTNWRPFKQEIVMANVLTGEVRRLAHHRSRGLTGGSPYRYQPRVSCAWDGSRVAWASNMGDSARPADVDAGWSGYGDLYAITLGATAPPIDPPPPPVDTHEVRVEIDHVVKYHKVGITKGRVVVRVAGKIDWTGKI